MTDDPFFCEDCGTALSHDEIEAVEPVPQVDVDSFEMYDQTAAVYKCAGCGFVIGFDLQDA